MTARTTAGLADLYEADETAWLEVMSKLAAERRAGEFDYDNLSEFLDSMAKRDKRAVYHRLVVLIAHVLKWEYQPDRRSNSWRLSILEQQRRLRKFVDSGTLLNHAGHELPEAYRDAVREAAAETGLADDAFPTAAPWTVAELLAWEPAAE